VDCDNRVCVEKVTSAVWRFSTLPIIYQPGWRPSLRWAARVLGVYTIAALCGGLLFVIYMLAFVPPRETPTSPTIPTEIRPPPVAPERVTQQPPLVAQEPSASVQPIAFKQLLENKDRDPEAIRAFIDRAGLQQKYPLGFALFYSDGQNILYYGRPTSKGISFDPSSLKVARIGDWYCMNILPIRIQGKLLDNIRNACVANVTHVAQVGDVLLDIEPLATSSEGAAWVLGMKPAR
jgi:hypothetical protein